MILRVEVPPEVLARPKAAASARGLTVEEFAADALAQVAECDGDLLRVIRDVLTEDREILDRLAET